MKNRGYLETTTYPCNFNPKARFKRRSVHVQNLIILGSAHVKFDV